MTFSRKGSMMKVDGHAMLIRFGLIAEPFSLLGIGMLKVIDKQVICKEDGHECYRDKVSIYSQVTKGFGQLPRLKLEGGSKTVKPAIPGITDSE